jgi:hypothetical protein
MAMMMGLAPVVVVRAVMLVVNRRPGRHGRGNGRRFQQVGNSKLSWIFTQYVQLLLHRVEHLHFGARLGRGLL